MQTRPYPSKDGNKVWLSRTERNRLLELVDDQPRKWIAFALGLHGLRTDELVSVQPRHFRALRDADGYVLEVPDGKTGKREVPVSDTLRDRVRYLAGNQRKDDEVINVNRRQVRNWIDETKGDAALDDANPDWGSLGMHDLRRTWATDSFYSLAFGGVSIAEPLVMSWGGWEHSDRGRTTFRSDYLGPVPESVASKATEYLTLP